MKKIFKSRIFTFILGAVIFSGIAVYATEELIIASSDVRYKNRTVESSLNELYIKANAKDLGASKICKLIDETYGSFGSIGSEYECEVGDNIKYNFYLLADNGNTVELIMDRNITDTLGDTSLNFVNAMMYFKTGSGKNILNQWINILNIDLPRAQSIADAVGYNSWIGADSSKWWCLGSHTQDGDAVNTVCNSLTNSAVSWLFNYLAESSQYGGITDNNSVAYRYWTRDIIGGTNIGWSVNGTGSMRHPFADTNIGGVRPVITVLKTNLYSE